MSNTRYHTSSRSNVETFHEDVRDIPCEYWPGLGCVNESHQLETHLFRFYILALMVLELAQLSAAQSFGPHLLLKYA